MKIVLQWSFRFFFFYPPSRVFAYHSSARDNLSNCGHALMTDVSLSLSACVVCTCVSLEDRFLFFFFFGRRIGSKLAEQPPPPLGMHMIVALYLITMQRCKAQVGCRALRLKTCAILSDAVKRCQTLLQGIGLSTGCHPEEWKEVSVSTKAIVCHRRLGQELCVA